MRFGPGGKREQNIPTAAGGRYRGRQGGRMTAGEATMTTGADDQDRGERRDRPSARWLVDGMNLIGSRPDRWWNDPDRAVRRLIGELDRYADATGESVPEAVVRPPRRAGRPRRPSS